MKAIEKELQRIERAEERLRRRNEKKTGPLWKEQLERRIPDKVMAGLQKAFSKAFYLIFEKGSAVIEKTYDRDSLSKDFQIRDYAMSIKGGRKEIRQIRRDAFGSNAVNTAITTVEGISLGVLGIGLPDIVAWVGILLRGIYETAIQYGIDYDRPGERLFILKMIEAAMLTGENWINADRELDEGIRRGEYPAYSQETMKDQLERTANAFATEMLVTKFIQGIPVVGVLGGAANPVYYQKIMQYVQLKYRKRYLLGKASG